MLEAFTPNQRHAVVASYLGWTLDAFDFFIVVFLFDTLAHQFGVSKKEIVLTTTATLAMRPIGALLFGLLSSFRNSVQYIKLVARVSCGSIGIPLQLLV